MAYETDAVVIGAGAIGLAIARELTTRGHETVVLERASHIASETSSRNSEVIHAGLYYPHGSLKAELCVRGKFMLYDYLEERGIAHSRCGKLIAASGQDGPARLREIADRGQRCGVSDLAFLDRAQIAQLEPRVRADAGLLSPSTGILDSHQFMLSLRGDIESAGGMLAFASPVGGGRLARRGGHTVLVSDADATELGCKLLINASGLYARETLLKLAPGAAAVAPRQYYAKGHYYSYSGAAPFRRLVYPLPEAGGLGVHATLDLAGQVRFGPDVSWTERVDYGFDSGNREAFIASVTGYFPELDSGRLQPAYTGIRPKIVGPGEPNGDFLLLSEADHGYPGFLSLHGIESPGLTAALALAQHVVEQLL